MKRVFLDTVITSQTYFDRLLNPDEIAVTKSSYPWLHPHLVPENGLPKPLSVNKWVQPVVIAFGMPNDLKPFEERSFKFMDFDIGTLQVAGTQTQKMESKWTGLYYKLNDPVADIAGYGGFPVVESEIKAFAEAASPIIGLPVSYLPTGQETKEHYGNVRINLFEDGSFPKINADQPDHDGLFKRQDRPKPNFFGMRRWFVPPLAVPYSFPETEARLRSPFLFGNGKRHVEGYFLANARNEIELAVCYIWEGHKPEILRGLIRECLLRSLGFPDPPYAVPSTMDEQISMLRFWNGPNGPKPEYLEYLRQPFALTNTDRDFLSLLYDPKIHAGMDYMTAWKIIDEIHNE